MKVAIIDYSYIFYRSKYAYANIRKPIGDIMYSVGSAFGYGKFLEAVTKMFDRVIVVADGAPIRGVREQRTYKGDRLSKAETFEISRSDVLEMTQLFPSVSVFWHHEMEADETIAFFAGTKDDDDEYFIISSDLDMRQLMSDYRQVYCSNGAFVSSIDTLTGPTSYLKELQDVETETTFYRKHGFPVQGLCIWKE